MVYCVFMFEEALRYLFKEDDYFRTLLIGTLLILLSPLVVPLFILAGYTVKAVQNADQGKPLPEFKDYKDLIVDGLKLIAVFLVYISGFVALMFLTTLLGAIDEILGLLMFWIIVPIYFGLFYIIPSIVYHFSREKSIRDSLRVRKVVNSAYSITYLKVFLLLLGVYLVFSIGQALLAATLIGLLAVPFTLFYELTVNAKLISEIE